MSVSETAFQLRLVTTDRDDGRSLQLHQTAVSQVVWGKVRSAGNRWFHEEGDRKTPPKV